MAGDVHEDALHAVLVKFVVLAKAHQVAQQAGLVDLRAAVGNLHAAPVGLAGDGAVALEQMAGERLLHGLLVKSGGEQLRRGRAVAVAGNVQPVQAQARQLLHALGAKVFGQRQPHACARLHGAAVPDGSVHVGQQALTHFIRAGKARAVVAVQVELERLAFDDVRALARHRHMRQRHLRLAARVQPREFVGRPHIRPHKRRLPGQAQLRPLGRARQRLQQAGVITVRVVRGLAQQGARQRSGVFGQGRAVWHERKLRLLCF